jgi:hypothetical protein
VRRFARWVLVILILEFLLFFVLGLRLQRALEAPRYYLGSAIAPLPLDVGHASPAVLGPGQREEQVG